MHENQDTHTILAKHWLKFKKDLEDEDDEEIALGPHIYFPHLFIKDSVYELIDRCIVPDLITHRFLSCICSFSFGTATLIV